MHQLSILPCLIITQKKSPPSEASQPPAGLASVANCEFVHWHQNKLSKSSKIDVFESGKSKLSNKRASLVFDHIYYWTDFASSHIQTLSPTLSEVRVYLLIWTPEPGKVSSSKNIYHFLVMHNVWKSQKKSHSTLRAILVNFWKPEACGQTVLPEGGKSKQRNETKLGDFQTLCKVVLWASLLSNLSFFLNCTRSFESKKKVGEGDLLFFWGKSAFDWSTGHLLLQHSPFFPGNEFGPFQYWFAMSWIHPFCKCSRKTWALLSSHRTIQRHIFKKE